MENGHLIPIKALDNDFVKSAINPTFAEKQELQAEPLNKLSTKPIERKWKDSKFNENNVFYADFETCKKYDEKLKVNNNIQYDVKLATSNQKILKK